jgi:hypothetical protein
LVTSQKTGRMSQVAKTGGQGYANRCRHSTSHTPQQAAKDQD